VTQKTLGQIGFEAKRAIDVNAWMTPPWEGVSPARRELEEIAAQAVRSAVIEECASLAELRANMKSNDAYYEASNALDDFAAELLTLCGQRASGPLRSIQEGGPLAKIARGMREGTAVFVSANRVPPPKEAEGKAVTPEAGSPVP
jgi:hypothetical protein